jgi:hypothetical protein
MKSANKVTHYVHHADPIAHTAKKETTIRHVRASQGVTLDHIIRLTLELSRKPDATINLESFEENGDSALPIRRTAQS